ncbi:MAG: peptidylprolyl isomerase [Clostridiaceae bacterium]|nr:peptidylprolyl isomerase [Clostridiaceae bacterium]
MKRWLVIALCILCLLSLCACRPSPTAITVGGNRVDASEYAFYLHYNCDEKGAAGGAYTDEETAAAREKAIDQIITNEVVRLKCKELGLSFSDEQKESLKAEKAALLDSLGGKSAYVEYLRQAYLTDRAYDKFQEGALYYQMLYDHVSEESEDTVYTDEVLRQYFADSYITLKYIRFSLTDDSGQPLSDSERDTLHTQAEDVLAQAQAEGADFDALVAAYNDDPNMAASPAGMIISRLEAAGVDYMEPAFDLEENQVGGVYECADGYYILQRLPVDAGYFESNRDYIFQSALDWRFSECLTEWKSEADVSVSGVVDDITLNNLGDYVK